MTFKNAMVYTLSGDLPMDEDIEELLQENAFTPVHETQYSSKGWVPSPVLTHCCSLLTMRRSSDCELIPKC